MKIACALAALLLMLAVAAPSQASTTVDATGGPTADATTESATADSHPTEGTTHSTGTQPSETASTGAATHDPTGLTTEAGTESPKQSEATQDPTASTNDRTVDQTAPTSAETASNPSTEVTIGHESTASSSSSSIEQTQSTRIDESTGTPSASSSSDSPTTSASAAPPETTHEPSSSPSQSPSSETHGPTTLEPSTAPTDTTPGTAAPSSSTQSPTTRSPTTQSPTTQSPTTQSPSTPQPTLEPDVSYSVSTVYGRITGVTYTVNVDTVATFATKRVSRFLGIPYALPPTESRRFKSPEKVPSGGSNEINATAHKPNCPQHGVAYDEDCLYYNIWTVQTTGNANPSVRYPVLIYIHGGRFETGYSSDPLRQGEELVSHNNAVVVTFNYRLGALGFLTLNKTSYTGNYGIQDQKLAIQVIYEVIDSFGGNRSQIALMGLDAGSASIGFHMMSPNTSAYFSRVIMMGGSPMMPWSLTNDLEYVQLVNLLFVVGGLNCTSMNEPELTQCLQAVPINTLISLQSNFTRFFQGLEFSPVIDGTTIPQDPWHAFSTGNFHSKDLLIGSTNDEGANIAEDGLEAQNIPIFGVNDSMLLDLIQSSVKFYPRASRTLSELGRQFLWVHFTGYTGANDGKANFDTLSKAIGDWYLTCPVIQMAQFAEKLNPNVYLYYFTEKELFQDKWQASHGTDADYAFGVPTLSSGAIYPPNNKRLSERMMENFVQFAAHGTPTGADLWKPLNNTVGNQMNYINYNADARILGNYQRGYRLSECHFWNKTLAFVNDAQQPSTTTTSRATSVTTSAPTTTRPSNGTSTTPSIEPSTRLSTETTTRPPIGPCSAWDFNSATGTTLGVLLTTQVATAAALAFVIYKWKSLTKVASEPI